MYLWVSSNKKKHFLRRAVVKYFTLTWNFYSQTTYLNSWLFWELFRVGLILLKFDISGAFSLIGLSVFGSIFTIECFLISLFSILIDADPDSFLESLSGLMFTWYIGFTPEAGLPNNYIVYKLFNYVNNAEL